MTRRREDSDRPLVGDARQRRGPKMSVASLVVVAVTAVLLAICPRSSHSLLLPPTGRRSSSLPLATGFGKSHHSATAKNPAPPPSITPPPSPAVIVSPVVTAQDVIALSDLRYAEWIAEEDEEAGEEPIDHGRRQSAPSRYAFRMATKEICAERTAGGAVAFLARMADDGGGTAEAVGSAELSPLEFDGAVRPGFFDERDNDRHPPPLYVSDVMTVGTHRRMGIGLALMLAVEEYAASSSSHHRDRDVAASAPLTRSAVEKAVAQSDDDAPTSTAAAAAGGRGLFLHVESDNAPALAFYKKAARGGGLGYHAPAVEDLCGVDTDRLTQNSGTEGQVLLCKMVPMVP